MSELRKCGDCGEEWVDTGEPVCPFCGLKTKTRVSE